MLSGPVMVRSAVLAPPQAGVEEVDWEAPAGGNPTPPRVSRPQQAFCGPGDPHCIGQPCTTIDACDKQVIVLACGCRISGS
jgi:hypothetical protein